VVGALAVVVTAPLFVTVALLLLTSGVRSVIAVEERLGDRAPFRLVRFAVPPELRVRRLGRILVGSGLVALPQVFNVVHGDMSLIGPRPRYAGEPPPPARPGLVGLAEIARPGRELSRAEQFALDEQYAREWSLSLDARILATCVWQAVATRR
jgi:lipopolysaccharide/colanic/teichoic acid biosynthesis glycosyltransferase